MHTLITTNPLLPESELAGLSINELNLLLESQGSAAQGGIAAVGNASEQAYIGSERAKEIALADASLSAENVTFKEVKMDYDDGMVEYDVEFCASGTEYEYSINASTGDIISRDTEPCESQGHSHGNGSSNNQNSSGGQNGQNNSNGQNGSNGQNASNGQNGQGGGFGNQNGQGNSAQSGDIGIEAARQAAYSHAGVASDEVTLTKSEVDCDDGRKEYEIEFYYNDIEYDYVVAADGSIISYERESKNNNAANGNQNAASSQAQSGDIGIQAARQAAFSHAGVSESSAYDIKSETDYDDGRKEYEIEFKAAGYEYDYVIACDGTIISYDRERDD